jgi:hypothetical protein
MRQRVLDCQRVTEPRSKGVPYTWRSVPVATEAVVRAPLIFQRWSEGVAVWQAIDPWPTVGSYWPYATTLWDYIHRAMPYQNPGSLTSNQVYSLTAYILFMNNIIGQHEKVDQRTLPEIKDAESARLLA